MTTILLAIPKKKHRGFSLIELMISLAIGLVLMVFVTSLFFSSHFSARLNDDNARIQEDGYIAMNMIGRNLMQAGYGNMRTTTATDFSGIGFKACQRGFKLPLTDDFQCNTTAKQPEFIVSYMVNTEIGRWNSSNYWDQTSADCNGALPGYTDLPEPTSVAVINRYFTKTVHGETSLFCEGNGKIVNAQEPAQSMLSNVDKMILTYGVDTKGVYSPSTFFSNADDVEALPISGSNKTNWDQVISVKVCIALHSDNEVTSTPQSYRDCDNTTRIAPNKKLHTTLTRTFALRNHVQPTLLDQ
ncbi:PilW family protein [Glaciimonas sp. Gout2]|uniref:PilW family protein n=1 Tax=unclassified Glaciimonas TaxID=2644401 RepID=UPI002B22619B|nr:MULTISPECIES: PilW family protein [unclassified Glaciimonas]MEB0011008.1 PilW family protein [Glaciimonas sp. Cout2]MEB0083261.1 PilW family protein [Glaciimonas sp. Gout2]